MDQELTTTEASEILGVSRARVLNLIKSGKVAATKTGRDWRVSKKSLEKLERLPNGRPRKVVS